MPSMQLQSPRAIRDCRSASSAVLHVPCQMRAVPVAGCQNLDQPRRPLLSLHDGYGATQISSHGWARFVWSSRWRGRASQIRKCRRTNRFQKSLAGRPSGASRSRTISQTHLPAARVRQAIGAIRAEVLLQGARPNAPLQLSQNGDTRCHNHPTC